MNKTIVHVIWLSLVSLAASSVALFFYIKGTHAGPLPDPSVLGVLPEWTSAFKPERESSYYHFFVAVAILVQGIGFYLGRSSLWGVQPQRSLGGLPRPKVNWNRWELIVLLGIFCSIFVFDVDQVVSKIKDGFFHIDGFLMAPIWGSVSGLTLNIDQISEYGVMIPVVFGKILKGTGHLDYQGLLVLVMTMVCVYFCAFYLFLRVWTKSVLAALVGVFVGIGAQMFHLGANPIIWQFPTATAIRFFWDIPTLLLIVAHIRWGRPLHLWCAALLTGIALAWAVDTGTYLYMGLGFYGLMALCHERGRNWVSMATVMCVPWIVAFGILFLVQGPSVFGLSFWQNNLEHALLFINGFGALPMTMSLDEHRYLAFVVGLVIPVVYVGILLAVVTLCLSRNIRWDNIFASVLCVYGLGLYHYYVVRSGPTSYAGVCLPLVAIGAWGLSCLARRLNTVLSSVMWTAVSVLLVFVLWFDPLIRDYPGIWNRTAHVAPQDSWQRKGLDFAMDAALIRERTAPDERVPLFSSFDVKILMDAGRKPYFYYFPIFYTTDMKMMQFFGSYMYTRERMKKTLDALEHDSPRNVFVEKKLFFGDISVSGDFYDHFAALRIFMIYLHNRYDVVGEGKYLLALKRKGSE